MDGDGPGVDRPRERLAVAIDDVAAIRDQAGQTFLAAGVIAERRKVENARSRSDAMIPA